MAEHEQQNAFANSIPNSEAARSWGLFAMFTLSLPAEVILRRNFGERYFQNFFVLVAFLLLLVLNSAGEVAGKIGSAARQIRGQDRAEEPAAEESGYPVEDSQEEEEEGPAGPKGSAETEEPAEVDETPLTGMFAGLFLLLSIGHRIHGAFRRMRGKRWHSYSSGESWLALGPLSEERTQLYIEPLLLVLISQIIQPMDGMLGGFLMFSGFALLIKEHWRAHIIREKFLDTIDAQIEAQYLQAAVVEERPSRETEGFKVVGAVPLRTRRERERLVELGGALEAISGGQVLPVAPFKPASAPDLDRTQRGS
jgi:hypothetical protein